jgi:hypothetical protein
MELKGKLERARSSEISNRYADELIPAMRKEIDVWKCCDMILKCLALGKTNEAVEMCNILYKENTFDPITDNFSDPKSRKINETRNIVNNFIKNILK